MGHNPGIQRLEGFQFPTLHNLKSLDLSFCGIDHVDRLAFKNLGHSVEAVLLNNNKLKSLPKEVFLPLPSLKQLQVGSDSQTSILLIWDKNMTAGAISSPMATDLRIDVTHQIITNIALVSWSPYQ